MAIIRKAIIIGNNTGYCAPTYLGGVDKDMTNYVSYLMSDVGGKWDGKEIQILQNEKRAKIIDAINRCTADYAFVVFSGHGFYDQQSGLTHICVSDQYVSENELLAVSERQTLIMDCCREVSNVSESTRVFNNLSGDIMEKGEFGGRISGIGRQILNSRNKFDQALVQSSTGNCIGFACLVGQPSGDNPSNGGIFSSALIKVGKRFGENDNSNGVWLSIKNSIDQVNLDLAKNRFTTQQAEFKTTFGMRQSHPFAITNIRTAW